MRIERKRGKEGEGREREREGGEGEGKSKRGMRKEEGRREGKIEIQLFPIHSF